jgi:hypothetical protein
VLPPRAQSRPRSARAADGSRTRDLELGKLALYLLSYRRTSASILVSLMRLPTAIRRALPLALVALALGASATAEARPAVPPGFFGMVPSSPLSSDMAQMKVNGVESVRVLVSWSLVEPQPGVRNWQYYDAYIGDLSSAGLQTAPLLLGVPGWISSRPARPPIFSAGQRQAWMNFLADFAGRYGRGGAFWRENPALQYLPLVDWEVWNEPNLSGYWGGRPSPRRYVRLLRITRAGLNRSDPLARISIGGIFPPPRARYGVSATSFMRRLYRVPGARSAFDALALHPYARRPEGVIQACREVRRLMVRHRDRRTPIWITELGWSTGGVRWRKSPFRATEAAQAKYLRRSFRMLISARRSLHLERLVWHAWQDSSLPRTPWTLNMGLIRADGSAKPSLSAYARIAR